jgi:hypothetical protein
VALRWSFAFGGTAVYKTSRSSGAENRTRRFNNEDRSMKQTIVFALLVAIGLAAPACKFAGSGIAGSGVRKTEKRELKSFTAIDTTGAYEIHIACQKPASFEIEADDNLLPLIKTEVRDGILFVTSDERYHTAKPVTLRINVPAIAAMTSRGAGEITIGDVNGDSLKLESMGAASIDAAGKSKSVTISSTGAGKIDADSLQAEKATVNVTGAASVEVYATEQLDVTVSGAGSVSYSGHPKVVNKHVSGVGSVSPE